MTDQIPTPAQGLPERAEVFAIAVNCASVNMTPDAVRSQANRIADGVMALIERAAQPLAAPVETERARCIAICEGWIGTYQDRDIQYTTPREYAIGAVEDIIDLIRSGHQPEASECGAESNRHSGAVGAMERAEQSNPGGSHVTADSTAMKQTDLEKPRPDEPTPDAGGLSRSSAETSGQEG